MLEKIAKALKVPAEAIQNFSDEIAINIIANTFNDHAVNMNYQCTINPLEKYVEAMEENKKLYERLLQTEREKVALLERVIEYDCNYSKSGQYSYLYHLFFITPTLGIHI